MNRYEAKKLLSIIQAFAEGKDIQALDNDDGCGTWEDVVELNLAAKPEFYSLRIKPKDNNKCEKCAFSVNNEHCGLLGFTEKYPEYGFCSAYSDNAPIGFKLQEDGYFGWVNDKQSKYRPFKDEEECWNEMLKHQPFGWVKDKKFDELLNIIKVDHLFVVARGFGKNGTGYTLAFDEFTFADGSVFGVKEE